MRFFFLAVFFLGINNGLMSSTFNNYLNDVFHVSAVTRGALEFPRELPGFLLIFITSILTVFRMRVWAVLVGVFSAIGILGLGFASTSFTAMVAWMVLWNVADHLYMPIESTIALGFAKNKQEGKRLGQITGLRNLAAIVGAALVWVMMDHFKLQYRSVYLVAGFSGMIAAYFFSKLPEMAGTKKETRRFVFKKKYNVFYLLNILFGARKQLFLTFAPWLLIQNHHCRPEYIAQLMMIGAGIGFFFRQQMGWLVDHWGERNVFVADAGVLILVCITYSFSHHLVLLSAAFVVDFLMFSVKIATTTYMKKIADHPEEVTPSLSLGISLDHAVSMVIPFFGGWLWQTHGPTSVFAVAALLAVGSFGVSRAIRI